MPDERFKRETLFIEAATVSNMLEIPTIVEVLERKGLRSMQDLDDNFSKFRKKNLHSSFLKLRTRSSMTILSH